MSALFSMAKLPEDRGEIGIYRTPAPAIDSEFIDAVSRPFGIKGKIEDAGSRIVIKDLSGTLEIFVASGSIWWTKRSTARSELRKPVNFPREKEAIAGANAYLKETGLSDGRAIPVSVTYTETLLEKNGDKEPKRFIENQHVNYVFEIDDLPVWGPGAKIQVTFGETNDIVEVLRFWREPEPEKESSQLKLIPATKVVEIFQSHEAFTDLSDRTAKVQVDEVALGYYTLPPREIQACLIPVYRFKGYVSTEQLERYDFAKHVIAVDVSPDLLKRTGMTITEGSVVL